jgi:hypothetical protein
MPIISRFFGIVVFMHWVDHPPPHFHVRYQGQEAKIEIETGNVEGEIKNRELGMIQEWRKLHEAELTQNWKLAQQKRILTTIEPLG